MIVEYDCSCGQKHIASTKDIRIEKSCGAKVVAYVNSYVKCGNIAVVYDSKSEDNGTKCAERLSSKGYKVTKVNILDKDIDMDKLCEDNELVIGFGGDSVANIVQHPKSILVIDCMTSPSVYTGVHKVIFVDMDSISRAPLKDIASGYGTLMTRLLCLVDYRFYRVSNRPSECREILDCIQKCIMDMYTKSYVYYKDESFISDLIECIAQVGAYQSMMEDGSILTNYDIVATNVMACADKSLLAGEADMLVGWYVFNLLKVWFAHTSENLCYPADIARDVEDISSMTGADKVSVMSNIKVFTAEELARTRYAMREYSNDISEYIESMWSTLECAMKNFRRIYYDTGLGVIESITLDTLSTIVSASLVETAHFGIARYMRLDGVA